jgi:hypothetical protein
MFYFWLALMFLGIFGFTYGVLSLRHNAGARPD